MKKTSIMKAYHMKRALLILAGLACIGSIASAQTYRPLTGTSVVISTSYPSGNALTLQANPATAYTLTLPSAAPTAGDILRSNPASANTLIWTSALDMYDFTNGLTESGTNTVKWGGSLTGATTINTAGANAITFYNNTAATTAAFTIGGGAGTLTLDVQGGTTINTTGSANTAVGNSSGTFTLTSSSGLNVTAAGVVSDGDGSLVIDDHVEPSTNDNFSLGTNTGRWSDVFVGPSTVHIGSTTAAGDELALSYNTTSNTAIVNVGSTNVIEVTSSATTIATSLSANGAVTLGNGDDNVNINAGTGTFQVSSTGVDISTAGAISSVTTLSMSSTLTNTATSNQIVLGTTNTTTISATAPAASRVYTMPDVLADASFVMTAGAQTIGGAKTFSSALSITDNTGSTSSSTGALKVTGGAGIGENLFIGGTLNATGNTALSGNLGVTGNSSLSGNVTLGDADADVVTVNGTIAGRYPLYFEGLTDNGFETRFEITDPTADNTITFPNVSGTVITTGNTSDLATLAWLVGGNTITGATTTRRIGIAAQAADDDGFAIMTDGTDRLTITAAGAATFSGTLASTGAFNANGNATLGDGDDNVNINAGTGTFQVSSTGVDISTAGAVSSVTTLSMSSTLTNTATSNQIVLGTTNTTTISATAPAASRVYTMPDVLADASFVMTAGAQTIGGAKTFSSALSITDNTGSTSSSTGALKVTGGAGIGENLFIGGTLNATGNTALSGNLGVTGNSSLSGNVTLGDADADVVTVNGTIAGRYPLYFEGLTDNGFETRFEITDPTADNTITFPNVSGTVITTGNTSDLATLAWLVGGNTITGATTTRRIGIAAQAADDDGFAIMTDGTDRLTITAAGAATFSGTLASTGAFNANGNATLGDGDDNVNINAGTGTFQVSSTGVDISTAGAVSSVTTLSMSSTLTNTATSNQIVLGTTNTTTISATAPAASRVYTMPDVLADASFVMTAGAQTIGGAKTFSAATAIEGDLTIGTGTSATGGSIIFNDDVIGTSNTVTLKAANHGGNRTYTMDDISADASFVMTAGTQTVGGAKTFSSATSFSSTIDVTGVASLNGGASPLVFEGATADANELTIAVTDPTADRTITFPNVDGTVITTGNTSDLATLTWLVGGNTITGGTTTRQIGIAAQASNDDGLAIMTDGVNRLTITAAGAATFSGTLTSTGDFAVGASTFSVTAASGNTSVGGTLGVTGATSLNGNATLGDATSDVVTVTGTIAGATPLVFEGSTTGDGFTTSFAITDPTAARTITFPNETGTVVLTAGTQTVGGAKTFSSALSVTDNTGSTSSSTGALKVTGGAGIGENLYVGGTLNAAGNTALNGNATLGDAATDIVTVNGTIAGGTPLVFEGATADNFETSFAITDPTADRTITFPDVTGTVITTGNLGSITGFVSYNTTSALSTADANGTAYLFNVAYDGAATGNALGARIASDATGGTDANATGLTLSAVGTGNGAATGLTVSASGGITNKAINVTAGGIDVDAGGVNVDAGGVTVVAGGVSVTAGGVNVTAGGLTVTAGISTFSQGMKVPVTVSSGAATYVADDDDMVIIQTAVQQVTFPTGAAGRVIIVKNTSGADITLSRASTDTFEAAATTLTQATGTSQTFIFSGGVWYLIGN